MTYFQADLSHNISEEELLRFGKGLNFTDTAFTSAKNFSKLESQIRTFAELVLIKIWKLLDLLVNNHQVIDERNPGDDDEKEADIVVLDKVTEGKTTCSCWSTLK